MPAKRSVVLFDKEEEDVYNSSKKKKNVIVDDNIQPLRDLASFREAPINHSSSALGEAPVFSGKHGCSQIFHPDPHLSSSTRKE
jgi:hypothetical protein